MARPRNQTPVYKLHSSTGLARCWVGGRWVSLGLYGSPESKAEFARIVAELDTSPSPGAATGPRPAALSVDEVVLAFWKHADQHYRRPDGSPTQEVSEYKQAFKVLRALYGHTAAKDFGPVALKAVRGAMVGKGWARTLVNRRVGRIRRAFKWAASEQLVPVAVHQALGTLTGLQRGRSAAPETEPVGPVAWEHVAATLPFLRPNVRAMVELQWCAGMRPGEVCALRPCDIDTTGAVWLFRPGYSKMSYAGRKRVVMIGPRAQAILKQFTPVKPTDYYFSPRESVEQFHAERAANRKTPMYASHARRNATRVKGTKRKPAARYNTAAYGLAIRRAVERANAAFVKAAVDLELHVPAWAPNQLRHAHGTAVRHRFGLEAAQVALGHERADVTQTYAERNQALAAKVATAMG